MLDDAKPLGRGTVHVAVMAVWWVLSTVAGIMTLVVGGAAVGVMSGGGYVGGQLGIALGGGSYDPGSPIARGYIGGVLGGALGGAFGGLVTGLGQWVVVRQWVRGPLRWVGATTAAFALAGGLTAGGYTGGTLGRLVGGSAPMFNRIGEALIWAVSLALFGGAVSVGQWLVLRIRTRRISILWIVSNVMSWPTGWIVGYMLSKLTGPRVGLRLTGIVPYPIFWVLGELVGWLVGWILAGIMTAVALRVTMRHAEPACLTSALPEGKPANQEQNVQNNVPYVV